MEDAGNAVYLVLWRLFLPEVLVRHHLADLETVGDLWESIFGYAYLRGLHPQQELGKPCGQRSPDMLRFMLLMTWCIRAVRHFLPTAEQIKHGQYHSVSQNGEIFHDKTMATFRFLGWHIRSSEKLPCPILS